MHQYFTKLGKWLVDVVAKFLVGLALGAFIAGWLKNKEIQRLTLERATEGSYGWQVSSKGVRWKGDIDIDDKGAVQNFSMWTIEFCNGEARELPLIGSWGKDAQIKPDRPGRLKVFIPVTFNRYKDCKFQRADADILTGNLTPITAYQGRINYEVKGQQTEKGDMILVKAAP
jgi:hypothetical protein